MSKVQLAQSKWSYILGIFLSAALIVPLSACTSTSVNEIQALTLSKNQGLVGFEFVTQWPNGHNFQIKLSGFAGRMLSLDNAPRGTSIYLFKMGPGKYCIQSLYMSGASVYITMENQIPCFEVHAGELTYGGTLTSNTGNFYIINMEAFLRALKSVYPKVFARYVTGPKTTSQPIL